MTPDMNEIVGSHDLVFLTLDTLRYDVAKEEEQAGRTPNFSRLFPEGWEKRHSPGSFTYSSHHAFFAGFLPTPSSPEASQERLFATEFAGSETSGPKTRVFSSPNIVKGLREAGYHTACIGGVGFFNEKSPLACVLPDMFAESHWAEELGVTNPESTTAQFSLAKTLIKKTDNSQPLFLFINISALHQPNKFYLPDAREDSLESHAAALRYVDGQLPILLKALRKDRPTFLMACSDHGTLYGEDGFTGHRVGHEHVYTVPFATSLVDRS